MAWIHKNSFAIPVLVVALNIKQVYSVVVQIFNQVILLLIKNNVSEKEEIFIYNPNFNINVQNNLHKKNFKQNNFPSSSGILGLVERSSSTTWSQSVKATSSTTSLCARSTAFHTIMRKNARKFPKTAPLSNGRRELRDGRHWAFVCCWGSFARSFWSTPTTLSWDKSR